MNARLPLAGSDIDAFNVEAERREGTIADLKVGFTIPTVLADARRIASILRCTEVLNAKDQLLWCILVSTERVWREMLVS